MVLTKQYLRFVSGPVFGVIASPAGSVLFVDFEEKNNTYVAVPACENVYVWNCRTGERMYVLQGEKHWVTCFTAERVRNTLGVGYADGTVKVFNMSNGELIVSFSGHKSPVTCLAFDEQSHRLASGSKDTEVVLWDVVGESGLFRLVGHKGPITKCQFLDHNILITSSEDSLFKFWHLDSQRCFKTLVGSKGAIWDFVVLNSGRIITCMNEDDLQVWDIEALGDDSKNESEPVPEVESTSVDFSDVDLLNVVVKGKILNAHKTNSIRVDNSLRILGCHGNSKSLLLFKLLNHEETLKQFRKRKSKERKRIGKDESLSNEVETDMVISLSDAIERMKPIETDAKIVSFDVTVEKAFGKVVVLLNNNSFSVYSIDLKMKDAVATLLHSMDVDGHRSCVSTVSFSSNGFMMLSGSNDSIKVWNHQSQACTHTFKCEPVFCSLFVTGDNHCIVGTKSGQLKVFELSSHQLIESIDAHENAVNDLAASPDNRGLVSGSGDKDVKFWSYELVKDNDYSETKKRLSLVHARTLKMSEEVLCLVYSPNHKFIALSLLDCTIKVLFCDTLKLAFSLYGHKLPVSCVDISYDSTILASGSKDKNIKIWSLEFGNCLKSIFAHTESITCLRFIPNTHMIFTSGKDKLLKQWDCDNFRKIITLEGHLSQISALAVSPDGKTVLSASQDRSLRLWEKTSEPLVLEEEEEIEREQVMDRQLVANEPVIVGEENKEIGLATRPTIESLKTAEHLIEAIEVFKSEIASLEEHRLQCGKAGKNLPPPTPNPMLIAYSTKCPYQYMMKVLCKTRYSTLENTLLYLPFSYVVEFLKILSEFSKRKWEVELTARCALFLVKVHLRQIIQCNDMLPIIEQLNDGITSGLTELRDIIGFNLHGLQFLQRELESREEVRLFADATQKAKRKNRKRTLIKYV